MTRNTILFLESLALLDERKVDEAAACMAQVRDVTGKEAADICTELIVNANNRQLTMSLNAAVMGFNAAFAIEREDRKVIEEIKKFLNPA